MRRTLTTLVLLVFMASQALAWSEAGHKIVASIAFRQLSPAQQAKVVAILKKHPRFAQDFDDRMPDEIKSAADAEKNEWVFQQAAIWPDLARAFKGAAKAKYDRPKWHYINLPHFLTDDDRAALEGHLTVNLSLDPPATADKNMNAVQLIRYSRKVIGKPDADAGEKAVLLAWLFHDAGDIHQPLHSTALFSRTLFPKGDRGGNQINTQQKGNLHSLWDQFLGKKAAFKTARNRAIELVNDADMAALGKAAAMDLNEKAWLDESHGFAITVAYDPDVMVFVRSLEADEHEGELPELTLTSSYLKGGGRIAARRVVQAGYRLGAMLKEIAGD